jgi:hypothetical protein
VSCSKNGTLGIWEDGKFIEALGQGIWLPQISKILIPNSEPMCELIQQNGYNAHGSFCRHSNYSCNLVMSLNQMA